MSTSLILCQSLLPESEADSFFIPRDISIIDHREDFVQSWCFIQSKADLFHSFSPSIFEEQFPVKNLHPARIFYLLYDKRPIATAAVWFGGKGFDSSIGRLHWVAVLPEFQGRGFGRILVKEALRRFRLYGYNEVYLSTSTNRPVAVRLYLSENFVPKVTLDFSRDEWEKYLKDELRIESVSIIA